MSAAALRRPTPPGGLAQARVVAQLLALAAGAWVLTDRRMGGMDSGPGASSAASAGSP